MQGLLPVLRCFVLLKAADLLLVAAAVLIVPLVS